MGALNINYVYAPIWPAGINWYNINDTGFYTVPKSSNIQSSYGGSLWMGGLDDQGNLHLAAETYHQNGFDFYPGPVHEQTVSTSNAICEDYNKVWKLNKTAVDSFRQLYNSPGYQIPDEILSWPGNGPTGYAGRLAPFEDLNNNGIYEPTLGEYPAWDYQQKRWYYNELHGDQVIYKIFNDVGNQHTASGHLPIGVEVHQLSYAYRTSGSPMDYVTFHDFKIINKSEEDYHDFFIGFFADTDIGNYQDDKQGFHVAHNMIYTYNGDDDDEGASGYGLHPPAIGVQVTKGILADANDGVDNDRDLTIDEPYEQMLISYAIPRDNPSLPQYHSEYQILQGKCVDNNFYSHTGCVQRSDTTSRFAYPGYSDTTYGFSFGGTAQDPIKIEALFDPNTSDKRNYISMGPIIFESGEVQTFTIAVNYARTTNGGAKGSVEELFHVATAAQQIFDYEYNNQALSSPSFPSKSKLKIYPNPSKGLFNLDFTEHLYGTRIQIFDTLGKLVHESKLSPILDLSILADGLYIYQVHTGTIPLSGKIQIQR